MADFISTFIEATNTQGGMSLSNSFKVDIKGTGMASGLPTDDYGQSGDSMFSFLCDEAQLPNVQAASGTLKGRYLGEGQINYPHTRVFTEFQLGFQCDASMTPLKYLNQWFGSIFKELPKNAGDGRNFKPQRSNRLSYPSDYCRDIYITKTEIGGAGAVGRESLCYVMERAWPFAIDAVPLQFGTAQLTKVTAQFYYTRHHILNKDLTSVTQTAPSGQQYGSMSSDSRLKENITKVGNSPSGINIYEWNYKSAPNTRYRGVMAHEILESHPHAVALQPDGYLSVYYGKIDVNMEMIK